MPSLSRSSGLYRFVFGKEEGKLEGFPEPRNNSISSGLFAGLFLAMLILRPIAAVMFSLMGAMFMSLAFLIDGSYAKGNILTGVTIIRLEPWPKLYGRRVPPWILFTIMVVLFCYWYSGPEEALKFLAFFVFITLVLRSIKAEEKSPSQEFAEAVGPIMDSKLVLAYYRKPTLFPALRLVD